MASDFDVNSILSEAYRGLDPALLEGKQEYFKAITEAAIQAIMSDPSLKIGDYSQMQGLKDLLQSYGLDLPKLDSPKNGRINSDQIVKLMLYLQLDTNDDLTKVLQKRLDSEKAILERRHADTKNKINKNLQAMEDAAASSTLTKALGWTGVALAIVVAIVVTVATAGAAAAGAGAGVGAAATAVGGATGGATAGATAGGVAGGVAGASAAGVGAASTATVVSVKAAVLSWISAGIALTQQVLSETGEMDEITKSAAETFQDWFHLKKEDAEMMAQIVLGVAFMVAALGTGAAGAAKGLPQAVVSMAARMGVQMTTRAASLAVFIGTSVLGAASLASQGYNIHAQKESGLASADVTESKAMIALVQQMIEESQEELQEVLEKIDGIIGKMFDILSSSMDAEKDIADHTGMMA